MLDILPIVEPLNVPRRQKSDSITYRQDSSKQVILRGAHKTLEEIRLLAMERLREGEPASVVMESYGFCRTTIYKWRKQVRQGKGLKALVSRKATGRPRSLTAAQESRVFRWINGKDPRQYGFDFGLWTRQVVGQLIENRFGVTLSLASVGVLLARLGLTPQKPLQRAYERDPEAIEAWKTEV